MDKRTVDTIRRLARERVESLCREAREIKDPTLRDGALKAVSPLQTALLTFDNWRCKEFAKEIERERKWFGTLGSI